LNNQPGEESAGIDRIGRLYPDGRLTGFFAANLGEIGEVDHLIGCNMSWRRELLVKLGGLRDDYPGTEVREETDIALRVKKLGYRLLFQPEAVVTHVGAPQVKGRRFDIRYAYYASRNHAQLLLRNYGPSRGIAWRSGLNELRQAFGELAERMIAASARCAARLLGLVVGCAIGLQLWYRDGDNPVRSTAAHRPPIANL
jgi:GT2 family glycosyltransferase